jgi:hypothetical protein
LLWVLYFNIAIFLKKTLPQKNIMGVFEVFPSNFIHMFAFELVIILGTLSDFYYGISTPSSVVFDNYLVHADYLHNFDCLLENYDSCVEEVIVGDVSSECSSVDLEKYYNIYINAFVNYL